MRSYNRRKLQAYAEVLILVFRLKLELTTSGPASLPTKIAKFTVNKSPHIDKKSRDQLEIRTYTKLIVIRGDRKSCILELAKLSPPAGISVDAKLSTASSSACGYRFSGNL